MISAARLIFLAGLTVYLCAPLSFVVGYIDECGSLIFLKGQNMLLFNLFFILMGWVLYFQADMPSVDQIYFPASKLFKSYS
jgi:hypothetical protein